MALTLVNAAIPSAVSVSTTFVLPKPSAFISSPPMRIMSLQERMEMAEAARKGPAENEMPAVLSISQENTVVSAPLKVATQRTHLPGLLQPSRDSQRSFRSARQALGTRQVFGFSRRCRFLQPSRYVHHDGRRYAPLPASHCHLRAHLSPCRRRQRPSATALYAQAETSSPSVDFDAIFLLCSFDLRWPSSLSTRVNRARE